MIVSEFSCTIQMFMVENIQNAIQFAHGYNFHNADDIYVHSGR